MAIDDEWDAFGWIDAGVNDTTAIEAENYQYDSDQAAFYQSERGAGVGPTPGGAWYNRQDKIFSLNNSGDGFWNFLGGLGQAGAQIAANSLNFAKGQGHVNAPQSNMIPIMLLLVGGVVLATLVVHKK